MIFTWIVGRDSSEGRDSVSDVAGVLGGSEHSEMESALAILGMPVMTDMLHEERLVGNLVGQYCHLLGITVSKAGNRIKRRRRTRWKLEDIEHLMLVRMVCF